MNTEGQRARAWQHGRTDRVAAIRSTSTPTPGLRILVVEDEDDSADSLALLLRLHGHEVRIARTGPAGIQACQQEQPQVVLLDIGLPGMNGWQVATHLKEQVGGRKPLIIAISGFGQEADRRHSAESGIDLHLIKPADPEKLESLLRRFQALLGNDEGSAR